MYKLLLCFLVLINFVVAMNSWFTMFSLRCLKFFCSFFFTSLCETLDSSSKSTTKSYTDHFASIVPESSPTVRFHDKYAVPFGKGYYTGGERLVGRNLILLEVIFDFDPPGMSIKLLPMVFINLKLTYISGRHTGIMLMEAIPCTDLIIIDLLVGRALSYFCRMGSAQRFRGSSAWWDRLLGNL